MSKLTAEQKRRCRKRGWSDGKNKICPDGKYPYSIAPYVSHEACIEFEEAYFEGESATPDDRNPYGIYKD